MCMGIRLSTAIPKTGKAGYVRRFRTAERGWHRARDLQSEDGRRTHGRGGAGTVAGNPCWPLGDVEMLGRPTDGPPEPADSCAPFRGAAGARARPLCPLGGKAGRHSASL